MGSNEARRQKQLAKKKAKRQDKRAQIARETSKDPTVRLAGASAWPIADVFVSTLLWEEGMGTVLVSRHLPNGGYAVAAFLVDAWCLGVKTAYWKMMSSFEYQDFLAKTRKREHLPAATPEYAVKLIEGAVAYARALGFAPDADYRHARLLLIDIDPSLCAETFTFGKDGKPFYVRGPNESISQAQSIGRRITALGGHFLIPLGPPPEDGEPQNSSISPPDDQ